VLWDPWDFTGANDMQLALNIIYQEGFERFCDFAFLCLSVCCGISAILRSTRQLETSLIVEKNPRCTGGYRSKGGYSMCFGTLGILPVPMTCNWP
jgi:hypothetical protein